MANGLVERSYLQDIADALREKTGGGITYTVSSGTAWLYFLTGGTYNVTLPNGEVWHFTIPMENGMGFGQNLYGYTAAAAIRPDGNTIRLSKGTDDYGTYPLETGGVDGADGEIVFASDSLRTLTLSGDTYKPDEMAGAIRSIQTAAAASEVRFYDCDGTRVLAFTKDEFAALTAMPDNPGRDGLTARGWNWPLDKAQAYVAKYGKLEIGQTYATEDGKTRIYIKLDEGRLSPYLGIAVNGTATVDWGDGSTEDVTGSDTTTVISTPHTYAAAGSYVIAIAVSGSMALLGDSTYGSKVLWANRTTKYQNCIYQNAIQRVEVGGNCGIGGNAFNNCCSLASVTIPEGVSSIGEYAFTYCYSLASVTIPEGVSSIGDYVFNYCYALASVAMPESVSSIGDYAFSYCYSLASVTIPEGVASIGESVFYNCYSLASVTIPEGVSSIGNSVFYNCRSLASVTIPESVSSIGGTVFINCYNLASVTIRKGVTSIGGSMFSYCYALTSVAIPEGVTSIGGSMFSGCYCLTSVAIPEGVRSIGNSAFMNCCSLASVAIPEGVTSIGTNAFSGCYSLVSVTIPESMTSVSVSAFKNCCGLSRVKFEGATPPTLANSNVWTGLPTDCVIYVPQGSLSSYTSAANYPSSDTYTYVEY